MQITIATHTLNMYRLRLARVAVIHEVTLVSIKTKLDSQMYLLFTNKFKIIFFTTQNICCFFLLSFFKCTVYLKDKICNSRPLDDFISLSKEENKQVCLMTCSSVGSWELSSLACENLT